MKDTRNDAEPGVGEDGATPIDIPPDEMDAWKGPTEASPGGEFVVPAVETYNSRSPYTLDELAALRTAVRGVIKHRDTQEETESKEREEFLVKLRAAVSKNGSPRRANAIRAIRQLVQREVKAAKTLPDEDNSTAATL